MTEFHFLNQKGKGLTPDHHYLFKQVKSTEAPDGIRYSLHGKGASEEPMNLFTVNPLNGCVKVNEELDREKIPTYYVSLVFTHTLRKGLWPPGCAEICDFLHCY